MIQETQPCRICYPDIKVWSILRPTTSACWIATPLVLREGHLILFKTVYNMHKYRGLDSGVPDNTGALARFTLLNYSTKIVIIACRKGKPKDPNREALELKSCMSRRQQCEHPVQTEITLPFSQALVTWAIVSDIK